MKNEKKRGYIFFFTILTIGFVFYRALFSNTLLHHFFSKKIWVHRVNSIEKLDEVSNKFYGVELDVVFIDSLNSFDVTHPPEPSINLSLLEYLKSCKSSQIHFWIDFKNLNGNNMEKSLTKLKSICNQLNLDKKKFIIESMNPNYLIQFKKSGFATSYYLIWPGLYRLNEDSLVKKVNIIHNNIKDNSLVQISSNYHDYEIMKDNFPTENKLLWLTGEEKEYSSSVKERFFLYKILMDNKVKVLLVEYNSKAINR